jgi:hypothetical protein
MKPVWKWIIGIGLAVVVIGLLAMPFILHPFLPLGGYGMMPGRGFAGHMPMHYGFGYGWSPMMGGFGFGMLLSGLIQLGVLALIVLGIIWLVRQLRTPNHN